MVFGTSAGCNPGDAAVCDTHLFTAEVPQLLTVSGTVRHRSGAAVPNVVVSAQRDDEPTFRPAAVTNLNGAMPCSYPAARTLRTPNGASAVEAPVALSGPGLPGPGPAGSASTPRRSRLTWATDK